MAMMTRTTAAQALTDWLDANDCPIAELARQTDIDPSELSKFKHGKLKRLSWEKAGKISAVTKIPLSELGYEPVLGAVVSV